MTDTCSIILKEEADIYLSHEASIWFQLLFILEPRFLPAGPPPTSAHPASPGTPGALDLDSPVTAHKQPLLTVNKRRNINREGEKG